MTSQFVQSKRPSERSTFETGGRAKWQKTTHSSTQKNYSKNSQGTYVFRVLCPGSKSGSIIGKGGGIIAKIRQEAGAHIKLQEAVPGCDERVIVVTAFEKDTGTLVEKLKQNNEPASDCAQDDSPKGSNKNDEQTAVSSTTKGSKLDFAKSSAMKALLLIFERLTGSDVENDDGDEAAKKSTSVSIRLLVLSGQVGCLLGKGGSIIKQISADSGALIRILSEGQLPLCASPHDEIVQITGGTVSVRKAFQTVSELLLENPPRDRPVSNLTGPSSNTFVGRPESFPSGTFDLPIQEPPFIRRSFDIADYRPAIGPPFPQFFEEGPPEQPPITPEILFFRLLCSIEKVGSVIGKGGNIVKALQNETGCEINVIETTPEAEDRIIIISGPALPDDRMAPIQDALLRVQQRIVMAVPDNKESIARLLLASYQTGLIIGKGGSIIAEMKKNTGAYIRILSKDQTPKGVPENDEVVQVTGDFEAVQEALLQITGILKHHAFRNKLPALNANAYFGFADQEPPFSSFRGRIEPSPPRVYSNFPPFQNDPIDQPFDDLPMYPHRSFHGPGVFHDMERSGPWPPQGSMEVGGPGFLPDYPGGASQRRLGGFAGGPPVITHTSVDVVVPRSVVPSLYGEDGGCLRRFREISEAKIIIAEPRPDSTETVIKISGTPEQTNAAQSLLHAFVVSETAAA